MKQQSGNHELNKNFNFKYVAKYGKKYTRWVPKFSVDNWPGIYPNNSDVRYTAQKTQP